MAVMGHKERDSDEADGGEFNNVAREAGLRDQFVPGDNFGACTGTAWGRL
jgi:hypothetical protein